MEERQPARDADGMSALDGGLVSLALVAAHYRIACDPAQIAHELGLGHRAATPEDIVRGARRLGLKARELSDQPLQRLLSAPLPAILRMRDGSFVILTHRLEDGRLRIVSPMERSQSLERPEALSDAWAGEIVLVTRRLGGAGVDQVRFDFAWFLPSLWRYRKPFGHLLFASLFIQLFALVTPLFFQVVVDKVLVHKGGSTLVVIVVGLLLIGLFDVTLQYLRSYTLNHTTSRIDVELGSRLFDHLLRLPLSYFEMRATGQTVARIRELETVRAFLTGQGLSAVIDLVFAIIAIGVLFLYSTTLTLIVLISIPCYILIAALIRPALRTRINERFNRSALSQQFLVESVVGVQTLKAAAVEPMLKNQWEEKLASYVKTSFHAVMLATLGQNAIQYVSKATTALVLYFGALAVIDGELSVGALIAFNMIMGQATAPILRLSQLWQDFQQVQISVDRLGDILNAPPETRQLGTAALPPAKGRIKIVNLDFRYRIDEPEILKGISLDIPEGQVIGIVGPSGSGKSTLTKLIQRLYRPERGQILLDGIDISQVDTAWLRRQIGVVLQENMLFNRTIHDNIALADPAMPRAVVLAAARLAGADEFISRMPLGYDTMIEERGANLSGGQRQRIAIARALATRPRILIFDEATSALDYESERIIQTNMRSICKGRTVIIIAHRLAAVRNCDRIISIKDGRIVEDGSHNTLLSNPEGLYARLWRMQSENVG
ncbi:type I secretion system permease/ATPase [Rhodomicrobium lacus]|uniref:type I secretion system permease/ATPase n=1 Tax=Rhodomicrobium lacus TaxID=2498452 RepID=UPI000F8DE498|nr:type I secretion system permease/ATPase [Rhodomicrobium lacus]